MLGKGFQKNFHNESRSETRPPRPSQKPEVPWREPVLSTWDGRTQQNVENKDIHV